MGKTDFAVFVGRFQPPHRAHLQIMEDALKGADRLIVVVGGHGSARSLRDPWTFGERAGMIGDSLSSAALRRTDIVPLRDFLYSDTHWAVGLQNAVRGLARGKTVKLVGHLKDASSNYLNWFPQWELETVGTKVNAVNSSDVRRAYFTDDMEQSFTKRALTGPVIDFLAAWRKTPEFAELAREHEFVQSYRDRWKDAPFPPTFVTTDMVVVKGGHVLLVRRGLNPGKGRLALPGGFVKQDRSVLDSALDELKEETNIVYPRDDVAARIVSRHVFDRPDRDPRGRTVTHAFFSRLPLDGPLPDVEGGDDAAEALWMPLADVALHESEFFGDHFHIIDFFVHQEAPR